MKLKRSQKQALPPSGEIAEGATARKLVVNLTAESAQCLDDLMGILGHTYQSEAINLALLLTRISDLVQQIEAAKGAVGLGVSALRGCQTHGSQPSCERGSST